MYAESASFVTITPESKHIVAQDSVIVAPYPHSGDILNTGDRMQWVANRLGVTILAADLFAQKHDRLYGEPVREALEPGENFQATCRLNADIVRQELAVYTSARVIGLGQSLAGVAITGMQRYAESPFDVVQVDDGFNLRPTGQPSIARFLGYQALDTGQQLLHKLRGNDTIGVSLLERHDWSRHKDGGRKGILANIRDLSGIMRSAESRQGVEALANDPTQRLHVVGFTNGISGSSIEVSSFFLDLQEARQSAVDHSSQSRQLSPNSERLRTTMVEGWHSTALHPSVLADNLTKTLALATAA